MRRGAAERPRRAPDRGTYCSQNGADVTYAEGHVRPTRRTAWCLQTLMPTIPAEVAEAISTSEFTILTFARGHW
eukprot:COSAG02_NODE_2639_length_8352_cov_5.696959_5_plen_74_part_00